MEVRVDRRAWLKIYGESEMTRRSHVGEVARRKVAFVPRHGRDHRFPPHRIPYRANMWALRSIGVRQVLAPSAVGSLTPSYGPGTLVIPDQLVDRTSGRAQTCPATELGSLPS